MSRKAAHPPGKPLVLVFGESEHDSRAIKALVGGLAPGLKHCVEHRRQPLVLIKKALPRKARSNAERIADLARIEGRVHRVLAVLAHEDCDAFEPEHLVVADRIESELRSAGCPNPIAVAPAWEIEAWWLIFPEAVGKLVEGWREPSDWLGRDVGRLKDAKEQLAKAVQPRPAGRSSPRTYHERDSIEIAQNIVADELLTSFTDGRRSTRHAGGSVKHTRSSSFEEFRQKVLRIALSVVLRA